MDLKRQMEQQISVLDEMTKLIKSCERKKLLDDVTAEELGGLTKYIADMDSSCKLIIKLVDKLEKGKADEVKTSKPKKDAKSEETEPKVEEPTVNEDEAFEDDDLDFLD